MRILSVEPITKIEGPLPGGFYRVNDKAYLTGITVTSDVLAQPENYVLQLVSTDLSGEHYTIVSYP